DRGRRPDPVLAPDPGPHEGLKRGRSCRQRFSRRPLILAHGSSIRGPMEKPLARRKRLYLRRELHVIRGAVEAARILAEAVATDQLGPARDHHRAPRALTSLLSLVEARLRGLHRAARRGGAPRSGRATRGAGGARLSPDER